LLIGASRSDAGLVLSVRDDGPGFPEAVLRGVTGPFSSTRPGGTGLGLRLVRRMVGEMGGSLELNNPTEGGASAVVKIPCAREAS
jgi:two-component system sensor histidine kinase RegB